MAIFCHVPHGTKKLLRKQQFHKKTVLSGLFLIITACMLMLSTHYPVTRLFVKVEEYEVPWQVYVVLMNSSLYNDDSRMTYQHQNVHCQPIRRYAYIKVEKTGSSTLTSILARHIRKHRQNVMSMTSGGHLDITKSRREKPGWDIGPIRNSRAEVLIEHARYNEKFIRDNFVSDVQLITSVRDTVSWLQSAVHFWHRQADEKTAEGLTAAGRHGTFYSHRAVLGDQYNGLESIFHLSQLQWLGFDYALRDNLTAISEYIQYIIPKFNVIFLTDQFDASLVRMKRRFCWQHGDILYNKHEVGRYRQQGMSPGYKKKLLSMEMNLGDQMLYEAFNRTWWTQPEVNTQDFWNEVKYFKTLNAHKSRQCKELSWYRDTYVYNNTIWSEGFTLTRSLCRELSLSKVFLMEWVARYALGYRYGSQK